MAEAPTAPAAGPVAPKKSRKKLVLAALALLVVLGAVGYFLSQNNKSGQQNANHTGNGNSLSSSVATATGCTPITATSIDNTSANQTYENFTKAVATANQTCADGLSTTYFLSLSKTKFSAPDGAWITIKSGKHESMADDFALLPASFQSSKFSQKDYARAVPLGSTNPPAATGTTVSYPVDLSKYNGSSNAKMQISVSMVVDKGVIKVDDFTIEPQNP